MGVLRDSIILVHFIAQQTAPKVVRQTYSIAQNRLSLLPFNWLRISGTVTSSRLAHSGPQWFLLPRVCYYYYFIPSFCNMPVSCRSKFDLYGWMIVELCPRINECGTSSRASMGCCSIELLLLLHTSSGVKVVWFARGYIEVSLL